MMEKTLVFSKTFLAALILSGMSGLTLAPCAQSDKSSVPPGIKEKFGSSVYTVHAYSNIISPKAGGNTLKKRHNVGTAFPLDNQGHFLIMRCVAKEAEKIMIQGDRGVNIDAAAIGCDSAGGIAVLKADIQTPFSMPPIRPINSVLPGSKVVFLGIPPGKNLSTMTGIVQSANESNGSIIVSVSGEPGTSGTPVFDETGQMVGILAYRLDDKENPARLSSRNKTYVVFSMEYVSVLAKSVIYKAEAQSGWLGVSIAVNGGFVQNVAKASPAEKCGIKPGDTIKEINGEPVLTPDCIVRMMSATRSGETVRLKILRSGQPIFMNVKLSEHPQTLPMK
jgi:serine protease Do